MAHEFVLKWRNVRNYAEILYALIAVCRVLFDLRKSHNYAGSVTNERNSAIKR